MEKLHCYVDETGQHTLGKLFVVAVVVTREQRDELAALLEEIEASSGKKATKWMKSSRERKEAYFAEIAQNPVFYNHLFYALSRGSTDYQLLTLVAIAGAIHGAHAGGSYKASVFIDGLKRKEERPVSTRLHRIGIHTEKVRGVTDESSPFIRLADALAGLVRDAEEGKLYAIEILKRLIAAGVVREI